MRMWCVPTVLLCRNHLLGEHNELHKLVGSINKGKNLKRYISNKFICFRRIHRRHEQLVKEFERREYNHKSPLVYNDTSSKIIIDKDKMISNVKELICRCEKCRERFEKTKKIKNV